MHAQVKPPSRLGAQCREKHKAVQAEAHGKHTGGLHSQGKGKRVLTHGRFLSEEVLQTCAAALPGKSNAQTLAFKRQGIAETHIVDHHIRDLLKDPVGDTHLRTGKQGEACRIVGRRRPVLTHAGKRPAQSSHPGRKGEVQGHRPQAPHKKQHSQMFHDAHGIPPYRTTPMGLRITTRSP